MPTFDLYLPPQTYSPWRAKRQHIHPVAAAWHAGFAPGSSARASARRWPGSTTIMLRDIGITRVDAARECEKPFWR